jgi:hypothetical protein
MVKLFIVSIVCVLLLWAQNTSACSWQAKLLDETTREIKHFAISETALKIPLFKAEKGVNVECRLQSRDGSKTANIQVIGVEISCLYPEGQIVTTRATMTLDLMTSEITTRPATLMFTSLKQLSKSVYTLTVDCK